MGGGGGRETCYRSDATSSPLECPGEVGGPSCQLRQKYITGVLPGEHVLIFSFTARAGMFQSKGGTSCRERAERARCTCDLRT